MPTPAEKILRDGLETIVLNGTYNTHPGRQMDGTLVPSKQVVHGLAKFAREALARVDALPTPVQSAWIPVSERLPEIPFGKNGPYGVSVLCAVFDEAEFADGFDGYSVEIGSYCYRDDRIGHDPCPELDPSIAYKKDFHFIGYGDYGSGDGFDIPWHQVTHWQPLPQPPKQGGE